MINCASHASAAGKRFWEVDPRLAATLTFFVVPVSYRRFARNVRSSFWEGSGLGAVAATLEQLQRGAMPCN